MTLLLLLAVLVLSACPVTVQQYDEQTVANVRKTIDHERKTMARIEATFPADKLAPFRVLHDAEIDRLDAWLLMEEAKSEKPPQ